MSGAERTRWSSDDRARAALLWDHANLLGRSDTGSQQWRRALELDFADFGELVDTDPLSLAAHVVYAVMSENRSRATELRSVLSAVGPLGELFDCLLGLSLDLDEAETARVALATALRLVDDLDDRDLQARLLVRLTAFSELRGEREQAALAAQRAVAATGLETRLGVVARRWATQFGIEVAGFNPWTTDTPEDPFLALPWVQSVAVSAAAKMAAERFEQKLASPWDTGFHIGRTNIDDLNAALTQAEWCGALQLRSNIRKLMSTHVLTDPASTANQIRWGLVVWASEPTAKRVTTAIRQAERQLDPAEAATLLAAVRREPGSNDDASVEVAAGVWNLLDDAAADELLTWLPAAGTPRSLSQRNSVLRALLWRRPTTWTAAFDRADVPTRTRMLAALSPHDLGPLPDDLRQMLLAHAEANPRNVSAVLRNALRHVATGVPVDDAELDPSDILVMLDADSSSVTPEALAAIVSRLATAVVSRLQQAAERSFELAPYDVGALLGRLASHLPTRSPEAFDALVMTCRDPAVPASWQYGALDGLAALRRAGHLEDADVAVVRDLRITPGAALLGEQFSSAALRASQLRVLAPELDADDIAWLAVHSRGSDVKARLVAIAACGAIVDDAIAVDWSLVGGLFDPDDTVVRSAVSSIGRRGIAASSGARPVARKRLIDLARAATADVRREAVVTAANRPELELGELIERARQDRAWTVRREAAIG